MPLTAPAGTALAISARSLSESLTLSAPMFSSSRFFCLVPGIGMTSVALRQHPGERELRRRAALALGDRLDLLRQRAIVREVVAGVARLALAGVALAQASPDRRCRR